MLICHSYYQQFGIFMCNASTQLDVDLSCFKMMDCLPFLDILAGKKDEKYNIFLLETKQWPGIAGLLDGIPMPDLSSQKEETPLVCCRLQCWWFRFCVILASPSCSFKVAGLRNAEISVDWVEKAQDLPRLRIFALHSMIPRQEQEEVFNEVPKARWFGRFLSGRLISYFCKFQAWFEHANKKGLWLAKSSLSSFADIHCWSRPPIRRSQDCSHIVLASNIAESSLTLPLEFRTCRDRADIGLIGMGVDLVACCERQGPMSVQSSTWPSDVRSSSLLRANIVLSWCCNHSEWSVKNKIEQNNYHQLPSTLIKNSKNAKNLRTYLTYWKQNTKYRNLCWAKVQVQRKPLRRWLHQREHSSMSWGAENIFSV